VRVPVPDDGENNAAYWRKRAEEAEAEVARLRAILAPPRRQTSEELNTALRAEEATP
jgi:hypothetical protein